MARKETAAKKTGYRWMMKCLRALDAKPRARARMRDVVADGDHVKVVVARSAAKGGLTPFKTAHTAAANEAIALLRSGSFACACATVKPGDPEGSLATPYPASFKIVITLRRF